MANITEDFSRYKKNELGTYLLKKELTKYLADKDKKKKKNGNPFISTIYSSVTSTAVAFIIYKNYNIGQYLESLKGVDSEFNKAFATLLISISFSLAYALIYFLLYLLYSKLITPCMNFVIAKFEGWKMARQADLSRLSNKE